MQWLCGSCNNWKGTRVQGLRKLDGRAFYVQRRLGNLQSMFSLDVYDRLVQSNQRFPSFRGNVCYISLAEYDKRVANEDTYFTSIDCSMQYTTCVYLASHRWPQFSKLNFVEDFDGSLGPGAYLVTHFDGPLNDLSWEGPRYYL